MTKDCLLLTVNNVGLNTVYSDYYTEYGLHSIPYTQTITQNMDYIQYCILRLLHRIWTTFNTVSGSYSKKNPRCAPHN